MTVGSLFPCPCCGYIIFPEPPGSYEICPICFWEDDLSQLRFVKTTGANHVSLVEGQRNYEMFGACEERVKKYVRPPKEEEIRETGWRPVELKLDNIEDTVQGLDYGETYPEDSTSLYYWRQTYWRRNAT